MKWHKKRATLHTAKWQTAPGTSENVNCLRFALCLALLTAFLVSFSSNPASGVPPRPDVLEKLKQEGRTLPTASDMRAHGLNVPVEKFGVDLSGVPEGEVRELRVLVILVEFPDLPAQQALHGVGYYEDLLFGDDRWAERTMRNYYLENSYGKLDVVGEVFGWYTAPNSSFYYAAASAGICVPCYPRNARKLAEDAVELASADVDFSLFDNDGPDGVPASGDDDGYVDAIFIVHAGPSFEETGNPHYIMSHQWTTLEPVVVDGVNVYVYAMESEHSKIGTFCHEFGHILGLPDLYDTDYDSYALDLWSLMGAGAWLDEGETPSHLDAWCKTKLGFVEPAVPDSNADGLVLGAIEGYPHVYKLWKNGRPGREYFLLENRQNIGFDAHLPGNGLLIYHVDETRKNNNDQSRYMVGLEQADGMYDLERRNSPSGFGADAGDPFPGWANNSNFTNFSVPNSFNNEGRDVEVRVTDISLSGEWMSCNVTVETKPQLIVSRILTDDEGTGDGDGNPDSGETARFSCVLKNIGLTSEELTARASCANAYTQLLSDTIRYGSLEQGEEHWPQDAFTFAIDSSLTEDPYRIYFIVDFSDAFFFSQRETLVVPVGDSLGIRDDFESGQGEWAHRKIENADDWHLSSVRTFSGDSTWHCGFEDAAAYSDYQDSFLRTPFFISGGEARLSFHQWLDVENENNRLAWDGCMVEVSRDNIHWEPIEPIGGYPYAIDMRVNTDGAERGCFSGRGRQWHEVEFDLSHYSGALWIRFRMITDGQVSGEGWYIDDVQVTTLDEPYGIAFESVVPSPEEVTISWLVSPRTSGYNGQGMTLLRSDEAKDYLVAAELYEVVYEDTSTLAGLHSFVDTTVIHGVYYTYALYDVRASGEPKLIQGPSVYVPHPIYSMRLTSCSPNPYVSPQEHLNVVFELPEGTSGPRTQQTKVMVVDVTGRIVAVLYDGPASSGPHAVTWDGTDSRGEKVASGVYVVHLETSGERSSKKVILLR